MRSVRWKLLLPLLSLALLLLFWFSQNDTPNDPPKVNLRDSDSLRLYVCERYTAEHPQNAHAPICSFVPVEDAQLIESFFEFYPQITFTEEYSGSYAGCFLLHLVARTEKDFYEIGFNAEEDSFKIFVFSSDQGAWIGTAPFEAALKPFIKLLSNLYHLY